MLKGNQIDPSAQGAVLAIAVGRIAIGCGAAFATGATLRVLGFDPDRAEARALARLALALGFATADPATRAAGGRGLASGSAAALVGAWAWCRLRRAG